MEALRSGSIVTNEVVHLNCYETALSNAPPTVTEFQFFVVKFTGNSSKSHIGLLILD